MSQNRDEEQERLRKKDEPPKPEAEGTGFASRIQRRISRSSSATRCVTKSRLRNGAICAGECGYRSSSSSLWASWWWSNSWERENVTGYQREPSYFGFVASSPYFCVCQWMPFSCVYHGRWRISSAFSGTTGASIVGSGFSIWCIWLLPQYWY